MYKNRLRQIRREKKMSGIEVAELLEISSQYYYDMERGKRRLKADLVGKLTDIFQATSDYMIGIADVNGYGGNNGPEPSQVPEERLDQYKPEPGPIPLERLNQFQLTYNGRILNEDEVNDVVGVLKAAMKLWKV